MVTSENITIIYVSFYGTYNETFKYNYNWIICLHWFYIFFFIAPWFVMFLCVLLLFFIWLMAFKGAYEVIIENFFYHLIWRFVGTYPKTIFIFFFLGIGGFNYLVNGFVDDLSCTVGGGGLFVVCAYTGQVNDNTFFIRLRKMEKKILIKRPAGTFVSDPDAQIRCGFWVILHTNRGCAITTSHWISNFPQLPWNLDVKKRLNINRQTLWR